LRHETLQVGFVVVEVVAVVLVTVVTVVDTNYYLNKIKYISKL